MHWNMSHLFVFILVFDFLGLFLWFKFYLDYNNYSTGRSGPWIFDMWKKNTFLILTYTTHITILQNYLYTFGIPNTIYKFFITYLQTHRYATFITLPIANLALPFHKIFLAPMFRAVGLKVVSDFRYLRTLIN